MRALLREYVQYKAQTRGEGIPFVRGYDHTNDIDQMLRALGIDAAFVANVTKGFLGVEFFPAHDQSIVMQSVGFFGQGGMCRLADDHVSFPTIASRPHIPHSSEVSALEYGAWHDKAFGAGILSAINSCDIETLAPHFVHWLFHKWSTCTWNDLSEMPIDRSNMIFAGYADQIIRDRDVLSKRFDKRQIISTIAVGFAGSKQRAYNAQSSGTAHVHTVARLKEKIRPEGTLSLNAEQEVMYGDNLYYLATQKLSRYAQQLIETSFRQAGTYGLSATIKECEGHFPRTTFEIKPQPSFLTLEQVLIATTNLNRHLGILWKILSGDSSVQSVLSDQNVDDIAKVVRCNTPSTIQRFPLTPCFTVVIWWDGGRITKIQITPALHGPAEITCDAVITFP